MFHTNHKQPVLDNSNLPRWLSPPLWLGKDPLARAQFVRPTEGTRLCHMRKLSAAMRRMSNDPDIQAEARATGEPKAEADEDKAYHVESPPSPASLVPLNVVDQAHRPSAKTAQLVQDVGGLAVLRRFTLLFYEKAFADPVLDKFIRSHDDPHGERFATWIAEKMGVGTPWSDERRTPGSRCPFHDARMGDMHVHDRSSAHFAAWHSPKREPAQFGRHFNLAECRLWMRLHFSAAREAGVFAASPRFADYYVRFIVRPPPHAPARTLQRSRAAAAYPRRDLPRLHAPLILESLPCALNLRATLCPSTSEPRQHSRANRHAGAPTPQTSKRTWTLDVACSTWREAARPRPSTSCPRTSARTPAAPREMRGRTSCADRQGFRLTEERVPGRDSQRN